jgi:FKBP-type peptidyl-prolyl cis-trans isomerase 2
MVVKKGDVVKLTYTITDDNGKIINSSKKSKDGVVKIRLGVGQIIPGFENEIIGMEEGESKTFTLPPDKSFGEFDPLLVEKIPLKDLPNELNPELGKQIQIKLPNGMSSTGWIRLIEEDFVIVDMNPPLAGRVLTFKVQIVETGLDAEPVPNPFQFGLSCGDSCEHETN